MRLSTQILRTLCLATSLVHAGGLQANNIQVSNVSLTGRDISAGSGNASNFVMVKFDLSWENSWRLNGGPANWDAAWVFVKYRLPGGDWNHVWLNNTGHTAATGSSIDVGLLNTGTSFNAATNPGMGAFVYRSASGSGNVNFSNIQLRWNYGAQAISDGAAVDIEVFAVEMVYVNQGSFWVGDGATTNIEGHFRDAAANVPFPITGEGAITLGGNTAGNLGNNNATGMFSADDFDNATTQSLSAAFPKGFNAFYCMKYELSQRQWLEFFNSLTTAQKTTRDITSTTMGGKNSDAIVRRNNINWSSGDATLNGGTHGDVACNYLNSQDVVSYLDWSGLRPMSELEYEKACRGPQYPVMNGFPWGLFGTANPTKLDTVSNHGTPSEVSATAGAIAVYNNPANLIGPVRVGALATSTSNVSNSSASFYGIQDLAGNLTESLVATGHATGRNLTRDIHGNGVLASNGNADISTWPGFLGTSNAQPTGSGIRGGGYTSTVNRIRVSNRYEASRPNNTRLPTRGLRGVRSAP